MILTDKRIRELSLKNNLIAPFCEDNLQSESYDVTIGKELTILRKEVRCVDIRDQDAIDSMYETLDIPEEGYIISPHEYIMVSIKERIKLPEMLTAHLRPRTRFTRLGIIVSDQHCNSTYEGNLRVGLYNATNCPIRIHSGIRVAQFVFEELIEAASECKQYRNKKDATYQNENGEFRGAKFDDAFINSVIDEMLR